MNVGIIPPINFVEYALKSHYHLVLPNLLKYKNYSDFYKKRAKKGDYIILDSDADEQHTGRAIEDSIQIANLYGFDEVMLPDVIQDFDKTLHNALRDIKKEIVIKSDKKIHAVVQGKTKRQNLYCLEQYMHEPRIDVIGISKNSAPAFEGGRIEFLRCIDENKLYKEKIFHLLGVWENPIEFEEMNEKFPWIRGTDTKSPIFYGNLGIKYHKTKGLMIKKITSATKDKDYFHTSEIYFPDIINENLNTLFDWCGYEDRNI